MDPIQTYVYTAKPPTPNELLRSRDHGYTIGNVAGVWYIVNDRRIPLPSGKGVKLIAVPITLGFESRDAAELAFRLGTWRRE